MPAAGPFHVNLGWLQFAGRIWRDLSPGAPLYFYLHGFAGSGEDCDFLRTENGDFDRNWVSTDWIGHGASSAPAVGEVYGLNWQLEGLRRAALAFPGHPRVLVGYSMGARLALYAALRYPDLFERLILISGTAGIESANIRADRRRRDAGWAQLILSKGLEAFANSWEQQPVIAAQDCMPAATLNFWQQRRRHQSPIGLAHAIQSLSPGLLPVLWDRLAEIHQPTLILSGQRDATYVDYANRLEKTLPNALHLSLPNCGHCLHMERPLEFLINTQVLDQRR
ncbi:MAG: alpha/beta fold hydrolase [Opitutales bacterium]|nr:alpha/beta fold hydrolase [Opitutales bacterium]